MPTEPEILPNESVFFARMASGDQQAFGVIFKHYTQRIYSFILNKTKSAQLTEEIVQEVFIKLWEKREDLAHVESPEAYITSMAVNKTYDFLRKMATEEKLKQQVWAAMQTYSNTTIESLDRKFSEQLINEAVEQLSPQRKKVFQLSRNEGMGRQEIAAELNVSVNTVDNQLREALQAIRKHLQNAPGAWVVLHLVAIGMVK